MHKSYYSVLLINIALLFIVRMKQIQRLLYGKHYLLIHHNEESVRKAFCVILFMSFVLHI